ncbi:MAG: trehalose-phosphatase [Chloroflexi bacterium]|nr:trehalose-phosphatase [Chloroflexota bacterium]
MSAPPDLLEHLDAVRRLAGHRPLGLFVDIDGTIAPIAPTPEQATVSPAIQRSLAALSRDATVVALTGRDTASARRVVGVAEIAYAGNHGMEWWEDGAATLEPLVQPYIERIHRIAVHLGAALADEPGVLAGVLLEDKGPSLAIHYRLAADPAAVRERILALLAAPGGAGGFPLREGKMLIEVLPPVALNKGTAIARTVERRALASVLVLGDDTTDVDAFEAVRELRARGALEALAVAVSSGDAPEALLAAADYRLADPAAVETLLTWLAGELAGGTPS